MTPPPFVYENKCGSIRILTLCTLVICITMGLKADISALWIQKVNLNFGIFDEKHKI